MPAVMKFNLKTNVDKFVVIAEVFGEKVNSFSKFGAAQAAVRAVRSLIADLNHPLRLRDVGARKEDFQEFTQVVLKRSAFLVSCNPRFLNEENLIKIYEMAW